MRNRTHKSTMARLHREINSDLIGANSHPPAIGPSDQGLIDNYSLFAASSSGPSRESRIHSPDPWQGAPRPSPGPQLQSGHTWPLPFLHAQASPSPHASESLPNTSDSGACLTRAVLHKCPVFILLGGPSLISIQFITLIRTSDTYHWGVWKTPFQALVTQMWSPEQQQHHLGDCLKCRISGPAPN